MSRAQTDRRVAIALVAAVASVLALVTIVATSSPSHAATAQVSIENYAFSPASITVHVGDTITWTNHDSAPHTVTSSSGPAKLDSPQLAKGESWSFTFTKAGDYEYYCAIHPDMKGKVLVVDDAPPTTADSTTTTTMAPSGGGTGGGSGSGGGMDMPPPGDGGGSSGGSGGSSGGGSSGGACRGLVTQMIDPFIVHFDKAHLETSPGQQASQASDVDQYTKTHTVLVEDMLTPLFNLLEDAPNGINPFIVHFDKAHLETSPGQQASQASDVDQYTKTHTVLVEDMLAPTSNDLTGSGTC